MTARRNEAAECRHRNTGAAKLRAILSDKAWHEGAELARATGWRFGAHLHRIRRGEDGRPPLDVRKERLAEDGSRWRYRVVGVLPESARRAKVDNHRRLRLEVARLRQLVARMEVQP